MKRLFILIIGLMATLNVMSVEKYTVGVLAKRGISGFYEKWLMHGKYLSEAVDGTHVSIKPLKFVEVENAVRDKTVDFLVVNPSMFISMREKYGIEPLATLIKTNRLTRKRPFWGRHLYQHPLRSG